MKDFGFLASKSPTFSKSLLCQIDEKLIPLWSAELQKEVRKMPIYFSIAAFPRRDCLRTHSAANGLVFLTDLQLFLLLG